MSPELTHDQVQELLGAYALDAVSPEERRAVEAHLSDCPRCRAEVAEHLETAAMLAGSGATAPEGVWDRIASSLGDGSRVLDLERARRRREPWRWVTSAVAAVAIAAAVSLGVAVRQTQQRVERIAASVHEDGLVRAATAALLDPASARITLTSSDGAVTVDAVVLPDGTGYLVRDNLRALPSGRTYQLWALGEANPISAGVLGGDPGIVGFHVDPRFQGLAMTRERAGGVVAPTLPPVASGEVQNA
jgi:anti-sigma-K factor RskA